MTQYLAKCLKCGGMVHHLEQSGTVEQCSACTPSSAAGTHSDPKENKKK